MHVRWESQTRYYEARLHQDLLGDWVLTTARGGKRSRLGALQTKFVGTVEAGLKGIQALDKLRLRHGYQRVGS